MSLRRHSFPVRRCRRCACCARLAPVAAAAGLGLAETKTHSEEREGRDGRLRPQRPRRDDGPPHVGGDADDAAGSWRRNPYIADPDAGDEEVEEAGGGRADAYGRC